MALTSVVVCCSITFLLVSVNLATSLDLPLPLHRIQRDVLSETPAEELNDLVNEQPSDTSVQVLLKDVLSSNIDDLRSKLANQDLLDEFLRSYLENPNFKSLLLRETVSSNDAQSVLDLLNSDLGAPVLTISNGSIAVDINALQNTLITFANRYIQEVYKNDFLRQIVLNGIVSEYIKQVSSQLRLYLADKVIPVECVNAIVNLARESHRSKRGLLDSLLLDLLRPQIAAVLSPIQIEVNNVLNNVTALILSFHTSNEPTSPIFQVITSIANSLVIRVAEFVVVLQMNINAVFSNLINGTVTVSRRRRDADLEFDNFYDFEQVDLLISHNRVTRSVDIVQGIGDLIGGLVQSIIGIVTGILNILTTNLNSLVKNIVLNILVSQYASIAALITTPLRALVELLVDSILPCSNCTSIV